MFSETVKTLRKTNGLSQGQLASVLGVSQSTVGMWETGRRQPDIQAVVDIAKYFGVTTDYLLGCEQEKPASYSADELDEMQKFLVDTIAQMPPDEVSVFLREMLRRGISREA